MPIHVDEIIERAFEHAFARALEQILQNKAEALFEKMLTNGSPLSKRLETKIEEGLGRFLEEGIRWEKKRPGFKR